MTTENEPQYVTRADCPRNPCQWPDAHTHWLHDLEDDTRCSLPYIARLASSLKIVVII